MVREQGLFKNLIRCLGRAIYQLLDCLITLAIQWWKKEYEHTQRTGANKQSCIRAFEPLEELFNTDRHLRKIERNQATHHTKQKHIWNTRKNKEIGLKLEHRTGSHKGIGKRSGCNT